MNIGAVTQCLYNSESTAASPFGSIFPSGPAHNPLRTARSTLVMTCPSARLELARIRWLSDGQTGADFGGVGDGRGMTGLI
jgi:hypothetical protein